MKCQAAWDRRFIHTSHSKWQKPFWETPLYTSWLSGEHHRKGADWRRLFQNMWLLVKQKVFPQLEKQIRKTSRYVINEITFDHTFLMWVQWSTQLPKVVDEVMTGLWEGIWMSFKPFAFIDRLHELRMRKWFNWLLCKVINLWIEILFNYNLCPHSESLSLRR